MTRQKEMTNIEQGMTNIEVKTAIHSRRLNNHFVIRYFLFDIRDFFSTGKE
jgi:hypothetical protein